MRVLITGVTGMVGSHMAEYLLDKGGIEVYGLYRWRSRMDNLEELRRTERLHLLSGPDGSASEEKLNLIQGDVEDPFSMRNLVQTVMPERIFHFAAQSYVPASWRAPAETLRINILGQLNIFEAIRAAGIDPRIHIAGSSEEYGLVRADELPIKETNPLRPLSPYAVSKVAQEMLAYQYFKSYGLKSVVTRGFNHSGPRRGEVFVTSSFAKQIAEIEKGLRPPILLTGDLESKRDWTDVRDFVHAYWLALEKGEPGEVYNIGNGKAWAVGEMLDMLLGMSRTRIEVRQEPGLMRPSDVRMLVADTTKFRTLTGWEPRIPFTQTLRDLLDYWRERV